MRTVKKAMRELKTDSSPGPDESKLLERLICDKVVSFLEENEVFGDQQFGFRKGSSTTDQLLDLYNMMTRSLDEQKVTKMLYIDVSKAFDHVWRKALVYKLERAGIRGQLLRWVKSYLQDRVQRVVTHGKFSS